jgi:ABC-2 type transport system permease protein
MYAIVETKLTKDKRYTQLLATTQKKNSFYFIIVSYTLLGGFMAYIIYNQRSFMVSMVLIHSYLMFMIGLTLIIDFSNIFLDTTDNDIIISKPVASNTFFFARVIHIIYYILQFVIALSVAPITTIFYRYGLQTGLPAVVTTIITTFLTILTTHTLYLYVLHIGGQRRLRKFILFFQTVLVCLFIGGYQLTPFLTNLSLLYSNVQLFFWSYFLPPVWMAVSLEAVLKSNFDKIHLLMICISIFSVPCLFWVVILNRKINIT